MKKLFIIISCFILFPLFNANATLFTYVDKVKSTDMGTEIGYWIQSWDEDNSQAESPCYKYHNYVAGNSCTLRVMVHYASNANGYVYSHIYIFDDTALSSVTQDYDRVVDIPTVGKLVQLWKKKYPMPFYDYVYVPSWDQQFPICASIYIRDSFAETTTMFPGSVCGKAPPLDLECQSDTPSLEYDFGSVPDDALNNMSMEKSINITCNKDEALTVYAQGADGPEIVLNGDKTLTSSLDVNGAPGSNGVSVNLKANQPTNLNIRATLKANGSVSPGNYSGSGIVVLMLL